MVLMHTQTKRIFLADGDALNLSTEYDKNCKISL